MSARLVLRRLAIPSRASPIRSFSVSARTMAEGDTGGVRSGGAASEDAFSKRGHADEEMYIRREEMAKLKALREKISQQQQHLKELDEHINDLEKQAGGEQN